MNQNDPRTENWTLPLFRQLRTARIVRIAAIVLFIAPITAWIIAYVSEITRERYPDHGYVLMALFYYGLFASPLLLIPLIAFFLASRRVHSLERRLMFPFGPRREPSNVEQHQL